MTKLFCASKFWTEAVVMTARAVAEIPQEDMLAAFIRHIHGDWGRVDQFDWQLNDDGLTYGCRLISQYRNAQGKFFLIITDRDRSVTTILVPDDY